MTAVARTYSLAQYVEIGSGYRLNQTVLDLIRKLEAELGVTSVQRTTYVENGNSRHSGSGGFRKKKAGADLEWETLRSFKTTVIEKKEGIEKTINDVRTCLNKISVKNYTTNRDQILEYIRELVETSGDTDASLRYIATNIFEIASTNKFFSALYAKLYKELCDVHEVYRSILEEFVSSFVAQKMRNIVYVDADTNYDAFCACNKANDARKASSMFLVNLMKHGLVDKPLFLNIVQEIQCMVRDSIEIAEKVNEVDELTENLFVLITESVIDCKATAEWSGVVDSLKTIAAIKSKQKPGLSSRSIFKYMDIVDRTK